MLFVVCSMSLLAVLGWYSQSGRIIWGAALLGLGAATVLVAAYFSDQAAVLELNGWKRSYVHRKGSGVEVLRPAAVSQMYSLLLLFGPSSCVVAAATGLAPSSFLLFSGIVFWSSKLASPFFERSRSDNEISIMTRTVAFCSLLLSLLVGLLAGKGIELF
jgi:1,4-dihydroxy-2-naphthoate octaprenyltransferase